MSTSDDDQKRWEQLLTSINDISDKLSSSHTDLSNKIQVSNNYLESISKKVDAHEGRINSMENNVTPQNKALIAKNIVLFRLKDTDDINKQLIAVINEFLQN